jgi:hypothetical protein
MKFGIWEDYTKNSRSGLILVLTGQTFIGAGVARLLWGLGCGLEDEGGFDSPQRQ